MARRVDKGAVAFIAAAVVALVLLVLGVAAHYANARFAGRTEQTCQVQLIGDVLRAQSLFAVATAHDNDVEAQLAEQWMVQSQDNLNRVDSLCR